MMRTHGRSNLLCRARDVLASPGVSIPLPRILPQNRMQTRKLAVQP